MNVRAEMTAEEAALAAKAGEELRLERPEAVIVNFEGSASSPRGGAWFIFQREGGKPPLRAFLTHLALRQGIAATLSSWGPEFAERLAPFRAR